jgi:Zn-dependent protease
MLACSQCLTLVHGQELDRIAAEAKEFEAKGDLRSARERWLACLPLLPRGSKQAEWVRDHALKLDLNADSLEHVETPGGETNWFRNLRPLWTLVPFIFIYSQIYGTEFGVGFALLILVHEMGHFVDIKRRGLPADMPVFLPGLGAYVRWRALGVSLQTRAAVSLAGPAAGFIGSVVCWVIWLKTGNGLFAGLARASAWLNILNLVPVWILDGGQAALALSRVERAVLVVVGVALSVVFWDALFLVVAAGALVRVFIKDAPERASWGITTYFVMVLVLLALVMRFVPVQGGGM